MISAPFTASSILEVIVILLPLVSAKALHSSTNSLAGKRLSGVATAKSIPTLVAPMKSAFATLFLPSPTYASFILSKGFFKCSLAVKKSARTCVGWSSSVRPFQIGTPAYFAKSSTTLCLKPLYSIPS